MNGQMRTPQQDEVISMLRDFDYELQSFWDSVCFVGAVVAGALVFGYAVGRLRH